MTKPTEKNKKHSLIWAIMLTLLLWLIGGGLTWWLGYLHYLTLSLVTTVFTGLGCGLVCYWLMQHNSQGNKTPDQQRLLIHKRCKLLAMHFERVIEIQKRKKRLNSH